jgi:hypothetical protein
MVDAARPFKKGGILYAKKRTEIDNFEHALFLQLSSARTQLVNEKVSTCTVRVPYELCRYRNNNDLLVSHTIQTILPPGCTIHRKAKENTTFSLHTQEEGSSAISAPIPRSFKRVMEAGMKRTSTRPIDKTTSSA